MTAPDAAARWVRVCAPGDVAERDGLRIRTEPPIAVFRSGGELFCIDDRCTHDRFSLTNGWVDDGVVECSMHLARFDLRTGEGSPPAKGPVAVHALRVDGDDVLVHLPGSYTVEPT